MIKFNQPKYIIPLIILPFFYLMLYLVQDVLAQQTEKTALHEVATINEKLPRPVLGEDSFKDKFESFQEAHKHSRKESAMREIDRTDEAEIYETEMSDTTTVDEPLTGLPEEFPGMPQMPVPEPEELYILPQATKSRTEESNDAFDQQMRLFKAQMNYVDSLFDGDSEDNAANHQELAPSDIKEGLQARNTTQGISSKEQADNKRPAPLPVEKAQGVKSGYFNTIVYRQDDLSIKAIIDEELKVSKNSRIRLRLLEPIEVGGQVIPAGHYLYGMISAFKPERVEVHISSLLLDGQIIDVALDIYDLDGMKGLYVPESKFRELAKAMGEDMTGGQQLSMETPPDGKAQLMFGMAKDAINTGTQAASKAIRKNKATLKYNTRVYLVNSKEPTNQHTL